MAKDWKEKISKLKIDKYISDHVALLWVGGFAQENDDYLSDHVALLWVGGTDLHEAGQWRWQHSKQPVKVS